MSGEGAPGGAPAGAGTGAEAGAGAEAGTGGRIEAVREGTDTATAIPTTPARLPVALFDEMVDWARRGYPNEACGIVAGTATHEGSGAVTRFFGLANAYASPYRYLIDSREQYRTLVEIDDAGQEVWGVFHSHVRSAAVPSPTDIGLAAFPGGGATFPGALYLICSLADTDAPVIRAWRIEGGEAAEVPLEVG